MKKLFTFLIILLLCHSSFSQGGAYAFLDINNIKARINANGNQFRDLNGMPVFEVPKGLNKHTIYNSTLWIGGLDSTDALYISAERSSLSNSDYTYGPLSVDGLLYTDQQTIDDYNRVWLVNRLQVEGHIAWANNPSANPTYTIPADILEWPAHGDLSKNQSYNLAPYVDVNGNGVYEPHLGDYPQIRGDRCAFFIFNDAGIPNTESGGTPLGIEVHAMAYAIDCPQSYAFDHTIFMYYKIFNRSQRDYYETYMGLYVDFDIGYPWDDYIGCDVERGSIFGYNGIDVDGSGGFDHYGINPPAQSLTILGGPFMATDGTDNPKYSIVVDPVTGDTLYVQNCDESINGMNFGNGIIDDERLGLTGFIAPPIILPWGVNLEDVFFYNALKTLKYEGSPFLYGGYGPECKFLYPGDSDPCNWGTGGQLPNGPAYWTEETSGNEPSDKRGLASLGPFTFTAGSAHMLDFAFVYGRDTAGVYSSIDAMKANIDTIRSCFFSNMNPCGVPIINSVNSHLSPEETLFRIYPNPAEDILHVETNSPDMFSFQIFDLTGRCIIESHKNIQLAYVDVSNLKTGMYVIRINSESQLKTFRFVKTE